MNMRKKLLNPASVFSILVAVAIIVISLYSLFNLENLSITANNRLSLITQLLFIVLFSVNGIRDFKNSDKQKRYLSYFYFTLVALGIVLTALRFIHT